MRWGGGERERKKERKKENFHLESNIFFLSFFLSGFCFRVHLAFADTQRNRKKPVKKPNTPSDASDQFAFALAFRANKLKSRSLHNLKYLFNTQTHTHIIIKSFSLNKMKCCFMTKDIIYRPYFSYTRDSLQTSFTCTNYKGKEIIEIYGNVRYVCNVSRVPLVWSYQIVRLKCMLSYNLTEHLKRGQWRQL